MHRLAARILLRLPRVFHPLKTTVLFEGGKRLHVPLPTTSSIGRRSLLEGSAVIELGVRRLVDVLVPSLCIVVDVGANIGLFGAYVKIVNPSIKVIAFEPVRNLAQLVETTVRLNEWTDFGVEQIALSNRNGEAVIFVAPDDTEASLNPTFRTEVAQHTCAVATLDHYCTGRGISSIDLLKIDTESTEPEVLEGAHVIIGGCSPDIICEVLFGRTESKLHELLPPDYSFFQITDAGLVRRDVIVGDSTYQNLNYYFTNKPARVAELLVSA